MVLVYKTCLYFYFLSIASTTVLSGSPVIKFITHAIGTNFSINMDVDYLFHIINKPLYMIREIGIKAKMALTNYYGPINSDCLHSSSAEMRSQNHTPANLEA